MVYITVFKILNPLLIFSSNVFSLLTKDTLSSVLYVTLIDSNLLDCTNYDLKQTFSQRIPNFKQKLQNRLIISYRVRGLTKDFLNEF